MKKWKDFFYYRESDKRSILLLLVFIAVVAGVHVYLRATTPEMPENGDSDSLKTAFEDFQKTLTEEEAAERDKAYEERHQAYYDRYQKEYPRHDFERKPYEKKDYPSAGFERQEKFSPGQTLSINGADTAEWKKIPGVGSAYAKRIVKYRDQLGGFVSAEQLKEVYGMDEELYAKVKPFVRVDMPPKMLFVNRLSADQLQAHPYLSYKQAKVIADLRQRRGKIGSIKTLQLLDEFTEEDIKRLAPYLSFE